MTALAMPVRTHMGIHQVCIAARAAGAKLRHIYKCLAERQENFTLTCLINRKKLAVLYHRCKKRFFYVFLYSGHFLRF